MPESHSAPKSVKKPRKITLDSDLSIDTSELGDGKLCIDSKRYNHTSPSNDLVTAPVPKGTKYKKLKPSSTYQIETNGLSNSKLYIDSREYVPHSPNLKAERKSEPKANSGEGLKSTRSKSKSTIKPDPERNSKSRYELPRAPTPPSAARVRRLTSFSPAASQTYQAPPKPYTQCSPETQHPLRQPYPSYQPHPSHQPYPPNLHFQATPQGYSLPPFQLHPPPPNAHFHAPPQAYFVPPAPQNHPFHPLDPRASGVPVTKRKEEPEFVPVTDPITKETKHLTREQLVDLGVSHYGISKENSKLAADKLFRMHRPIHYPDGSVGPSMVQIKEAGRAGGKWGSANRSPPA